ncbi:PAP/fibrillin family protein [Cylindrospermopsis curvispora]|uniref:Fimbrial protein n=1 Tax=Cylindrospermopsis curvispora GIHE-G1 TaxID=2666332 RepID=A0A7H0F3K5_9CYAN|nr:PAP/fibrillin family protein [Cylindrospermopsis curvispora]QNP30621.1 fimbrial protein [Cylindrospermopsis curvispora GIHE-G1]
MNYQTVKEQLQALIESLRESLTKQNGGQPMGAPITNIKIEENQAFRMEELTVELERLNPNPQPLRNAINLLNGAWKLEYSTAREIRVLDSLPLGLQVGQVFQVINVAQAEFFNLAKVKHPWKIVSGGVKVTARFEADLDNSGLPNQRINVYFDKRYLAIDEILGISTPMLNPLNVAPANNPKGRVPSLDITYLDENFRIGRGGDQGLFILQKTNDIQNINF